MPASPSCARALWRRATTLWPLKATLTPLAIALFFQGYFWCMRHPLGAVHVMPLTALDAWVPFWPGALGAYVSLWFYVVAGVAMARDARELRALALASLAMSLAAFACYLLWPTAVPVPDLDWARYPSVRFLKTVDVAGNACPSLHVAFAVLTAALLARQLPALGAPAWLRAANIAWCALIVHSTLATRQHVAWDVLAGCLLALPAVALHHRLAGWRAPPGSNGAAAGLSAGER